MKIKTLADFIEKMGWGVRYIDDKHILIRADSSWYFSENDGNISLLIVRPHEHIMLSVEDMLAMRNNDKLTPSLSFSAIGGSDVTLRGIMPMSLKTVQEFNQAWTDWKVWHIDN